MKHDSRLSATLHALLHMADHGKPMTSDHLALCLRTNPVVVRRTMAGLREAGFVTSERGHGGGWTLVRDLASVSLRDIHLALGEPVLLPLSPATENPGCLVEQAVNHALDDTFREAQALLLERFGQIRLSDLAADFSRRMADHAQHEKGNHDAA